MKLHTIIIGLGLCFGFLSCSSDESPGDIEDHLKSYEFMSMEWKLDTNDGQTIIEEKLPEYNFRNESDTVIEVIVDPLENLEGSSQFIFNDSLRFTEINSPEIQVSIPDELRLLSDTYSYVYGGIQVPLAIEASAFPFSYDFTNTYALNGNSSLTSHYTVFLKQNTVSFLATFRETTTGERLELDGTWTGVFFNTIEVESIAHDIDVLN